MLSLAKKPNDRLSATLPLVARMRAIALDELERTYLPGQRLFAFTLRKRGSQVIREGTSLRYTAIVLIGLAGESAKVAHRVLHGQSTRDLCDHLVRAAAASANLGDVALALWAARRCGCTGWEQLLRRLRELDPVSASHPTVEIAWALSALCAEAEHIVDDALAERVCRRLLDSYREQAAMFPHWPAGARPSPLRAHVACFADMVYPIMALAQFGPLAGNSAAIHAARACARRICDLQGPQGQWWWHYDIRSGRVLEEYPVYAVHQDAMAPMALFAAETASGENFDEWIDRGLQWLVRAPETGTSLIDEQAGIIWRKVCRREPGKMTRSLQALASRVHPALRLPGTNTLFPPVSVDYESRPYHMGWILYAWKPDAPSHESTRLPSSV